MIKGFYPTLAPTTLFEVIVGNIGRVYAGNSERAAKDCYDLYVHKSKNNKGNSAGEDVTLFKDGEPINEHTPNEAGYSSN